MITLECPWCTESVAVDAVIVSDLSCDTCGIVVDIALDPQVRRLERAA